MVFWASEEPILLSRDSAGGDRLTERQRLVLVSVLSFQFGISSETIRDSLSYSD